MLVSHVPKAKCTILNLPRETNDAQLSPGLSTNVVAVFAQLCKLLRVSTNYVSGRGQLNLYQSRLFEIEGRLL